jgi:hypothetical protein
MRKPAAASVAATKAALPASHGGRAPIEVVCVALALAILALACRIASFW